MKRPRDESPVFFFFPERDRDLMYAVREREREEGRRDKKFVADVRPHSLPAFPTRDFFYH